MKLFNLIKISLGATTWMTFYMNASSQIFKKQMKVIRVLGSLLTNETKDVGEVKATPNVKVTGTIMHYLIGAFFTYYYHLLWKHKLSKPNYFFGSILGLVNGLIGVGGWEIFMLLHPNPPQFSRKDYLINLLPAHIVFGEGIVYYYRKMMEKEFRKLNPVISNYPTISSSS